MLYQFYLYVSRYPAKYKTSNSAITTVLHLHPLSPPRSSLTHPTPIHTKTYAIPPPPHSCPPSASSSPSQQDKAH